MAAREYAPYDVRAVYEDEAAYIVKVQKGILALAQQQEQFDVFLCYKETDAEGNRSQDSVLAQELEFELGKRGYKVFFARKTLAGKLGTAYEPVIFSALHSAKVMVVLGTKPEHFTAVWVKNEWSRYRELIKKGEDKTLIPAYRGMSPYDLPQEFAQLQALDMGKLGFVQDLCDGIDRLAKAEKKTVVQTTSVAGPGAESLLMRAQFYLEDGDFINAKDYFDKVLDINPKCALAYIGKTLTKTECKNLNQLSTKTFDLSADNDYQRGLSYMSVIERIKYTDVQNTCMNNINVEKNKCIEKERMRHKVEEAQREYDNANKGSGGGLIGFAVFVGGILALIFLIFGEAGWVSFTLLISAILCVVGFFMNIEENNRKKPIKETYDISKNEYEKKYGEYKKEP